jgi:hypothetical protein
VTSSSGIGRLVEALAGEAFEGHLRNVRAYSELRRRVAEGVVTDREVNEAYTRYAREHAADYRKEAAEITVRYYQALSELGARYSERFYEQVLSEGRNGDGARREPSGGAEGPDEDIDRVPIELHGRAGREIVARFTLENTDETPTRIEFEFEPCRSPHGGSFHAPVNVQPSVLELEPGGHAEVTLRVALMPSVFLPGLIYRQTVIARGARPLALDVTLWVEDDDVIAPPVPPAASAPVAPAARPGAKATKQAKATKPATPRRSTTSRARKAKPAPGGDAPS